PRHRFTYNVFTQHRPNGRAAVAVAREGRRPRALELDVAAYAFDVDDLAQQERTPVAKLRHEVAELVAGIGERDRLGAGCDAIARQQRHALGRREVLRIEAELEGERPVELHQPRRADRRRRQPGVEAVGQAGITVVKGSEHGAIVLDLDSRGEDTSPLVGSFSMTKGGAWCKIEKVVPIARRWWGTFLGASTLHIGPPHASA